jgi:sugar-specific transcriptional regulator TrmB
MEGISIQDALEGAGLTNIEAKVYLELLELGSSTAGPIIKSLGLHRATVYTVLQRLMEKGLVSYVMRAGTRYFSATDPENILDEIKEREERLKGVLPQLKVRQKRSKEKQLATIYEGNKAIKSMFEEALKKHKPGDEQLVFGTQNLNDFFCKFFKSYEKRRAKKGVNLKIAINEADLEWIKSIKPLTRTEIKTIPREFTSPAEFDILGDRTAIVLWGKNPLAFAIDSKEVADSFRSYFNLMWNQDVKVYRGFDDVMRRFASMLDSVKEGEEYLVLGANFGELVNKNKLLKWFLDYHAKRVKSKKKVRILFAPEIRKEMRDELKQIGDEKQRYTKIKELPPEFSSPMQINLYKGNKVLMFLWGKEMMCFEIESETAYKNFKAYFDALWNQDVTVERGIEGVQGAWNRMLDDLKSGEEYYVLGATWRGQKEKVYDYFVDFHKKRQEKGVKAKLMFVSGTENLVEKYKDSYKRLAEVKFLPSGIYEGIQINLYKGKTLIFAWREKEPVVFTIDDKKIYQTFKTYFDTLWDQRTMTYKGYAGVRSFFNQLLDEKEAWFIGGNFGIKKYFPDYWNKYKKEWVRRKNKWYDLVDEGTLKIEDLSGEPHYEHRILPPELKSPHVICITKDKVANIHWAGKNTTIFVFESKEIVESYMKYFKMLWEQETRTYKGIENIKNVFHSTVDSMEKGDTWFAFVIGDSPRNISDFFYHFQRKRAGLGIKHKSIFSEDAVDEYKRRSKIPLTSCRLIPRSYASPAIVNVCGDTVLINFWGTEKEPIAYKIEDKKVAEMYKKQFDMLWKIAKK